MVVVCSAVLGVALARAQAVRDGPVAEAARARALATLTGTVAGDPRTVPGRFGPQVLVRVAVGRHQPVLVFGDDDWRRVAMGERVRFTGRLGPSDDSDLAALVTPRGPPEVLGRSGVAWRATEALRASIRDSVAHRPEAQRALVPALVDGDDAAMPDELTADFRTTGLTHLTAVSGHQPDPGPRVPPGGGAVGRRARPVARPGGGGRDRRLRAARAHRAQRAAGGGDGHRGPGGPRSRRLAPRRPRPRRRRRRAAAPRPGARR